MEVPPHLLNVSNFLLGGATAALVDLVGSAVIHTYGVGSSRVSMEINVISHGDKSVIKEGHKSFPGGLTSWSFTGLGFLLLYLSGKIIQST